MLSAVDRASHSLAPYRWSRSIICLSVTPASSAASFRIIFPSLNSSTAYPSAPIGSNRLIAVDSSIRSCRARCSMTLNNSSGKRTVFPTDAVQLPLLIIAKLFRQTQKFISFQPCLSYYLYQRTFIDLPMIRNHNRFLSFSCFFHKNYVASLSSLWFKSYLGQQLDNFTSRQYR